MADDSSNTLLEGIRVLEVGHALTEHGGRIFAGLGAEVLLVEPPGGSATRHRAPHVPSAVGDRSSIPFLARNTNKHSVTIDPDVSADRELLANLITRSDLVLDADSSYLHHELSTIPGTAARITVTDNLGLGTSSIVGFAASGGMACSGWPGQPPVNAPSWLAADGASIYAAMMGAVALFVRQRHGIRLDYHVPYNEAAIRAIAPWSRHMHAAGINVAGQGINPGRMGAGPYPVFETADGWVKIVMATPRQFGALLELLGSPEELIGEQWADRTFRAENIDVFFMMCAPYFSDRTTDELFHEGQRIGLTISPLYTLEQFRNDAHAKARELFVEVEDPDLGPIEIARAPMRSQPPELMASCSAAPSLGSANDRAHAITAEPERTLTPTGSTVDPLKPLADMRLLQLGSGAVVPEACSDFALLGADIVRVESMVNQDFLRRGGDPTDPDSSASYNQLNLGVRSLTIDMRQGEATELVRSLLTKSDAVVENMRAPVVENWGFDYEACKAVQDDVICLSSQGFGAGPYGHYQSFGPNLTAYSGAASQWAHPDDEIAVGASVPHPDHVAGKQAYVGLLAALMRRDRTGQGCFLEAAQVEAPAHLIADRFLAQQFSDADLAPVGNQSDDFGPHGCYPCLDDEWLVLAAETNAHWTALVGCINEPWARSAEFATAQQRVNGRDLIDKQLSTWTSRRPIADVEHTLRSAGVPCSRVVNSDHMAVGDGNVAGGLFAEVDHPVTGRLAYTGLPVLTADGRRPLALRPPLMGEHTDEIVTTLVGSDAETIMALRTQRVIGY